MILVSEIGDKTFFIAAIMAMRNDRLIVFSGAIAALVRSYLVATHHRSAPCVLPSPLPLNLTEMPASLRVIFAKSPVTVVLILMQALMTALSAALGYATTVISRIYTFYSSVVLFFAFGIKMLKEGYEMSPTHGQVRIPSPSQPFAAPHPILLRYCAVYEPADGGCAGGARGGHE